MKTLRQRYLFAIALLAIVAPLAVSLQMSVPPPGDIGLLRDRVPRQIGEWSATGDREPTPEEIEILETKAILSRTFARTGSPDVELSITYAPRNRRVAHPPELCYKGAGWSIEQSEVTALPGTDPPFKANRLLLLYGGRRRLVLYWYKAGPESYASYLRMQWRTIWNDLTFQGSSSALIRVSAQSPSRDDDERVCETLKQFAVIAVPPVTAALP